MGMNDQQYIAYLQNEDGQLLQGPNAESYTNKCSSWLDVLQLLHQYLEDYAEFYEWDTETVKEMVVQFCEKGYVDFHSGRFFESFEWDGEGDYLEAAVRYDMTKTGKPYEFYKR